MTSNPLRDKILAIQDLESEVVSIPQWEDVKIEVRGLTGTQRARVLKDAMGEQGMDVYRFYPEVVIASAHDPDSGEPIFDASDIDALNSKSGAALEILAQTAIRLSGLGPKAVDEAAKNSSRTLSDATTSPEPRSSA